MTLAMLAYAFLVAAAVTEHARHRAPLGLIPLTCNEIQHLFAALTADPGHRLRWSWWRRRRQAAPASSAATPPRGRDDHGPLGRRPRLQSITAVVACQAGERMEPEDCFAGHPDARAVFDKVRSVLDRLGPVEVRTSKSQVAFRRQRGFAFLWLPGRYLSKPTAEVVLSIALGRHDPSARFKQVAHPAPTQWMHHLEIRNVGDIDDEVVGWLHEAAYRAS